MNDSGRFRVTSWNLLADDYIKADRYARCTADDLAPVIRHGRILKRIASLNADVFCLQEVDRRMWGMIAAQQHGRYEMDWTRRSGTKSDGCATAISHRLRRHEVRDIAFDDGHLEGGPSRRVAQRAVIDVGGRPVAVYNVHLAWDAAEATDDRRYGLFQARSLLERMRNDGTPIIVCGDFNATPDSDVVRTFLTEGFVDAHAGATGPTFSMGGVVARIDALLCRGLRPEPVEIPTLTEGTVLPSADEPSDHVPISAWFTFA